MTSDLERKIIRILSLRGPQDAAQLSMECEYILSADDAVDREFFGVLGSLEEKKVIEWYPITDATPSAKIEEGPFPYFSRVYGMRVWPSRNSYVGKLLRKIGLL